MQNISTMEAGSEALVSLYEAASRADAEGRLFRISSGVDANGPYLMWKVGEGMWTAPYRVGNH